MTWKIRKSNKKKLIVNYLFELISNSKFKLKLKKEKKIASMKDQRFLQSLDQYQCHKSMVLLANQA